MKILAIHSVINKPGQPVDVWRVYRPLEELKKHVDWQIDYARSVIPGIESYADSEQFGEEELEATAQRLKDYDIIFLSYWHLTAAIFALLHIVRKRYGTKTIIDFDDDVYDIPYYNPIWLKVGHQDIKNYTTIADLAPFVTTTNKHLAKKIKRRNKGSVTVIPNYISDAYQHPPFNNESLTIGYFGGASHYRDLHRTGVLPALQKLMHEQKDIRFTCVGQPVDYYLPRARLTVIEPVNGTDWAANLFPNLNFDIALAPLQDDDFARSKSSIKWQEATRMGAAFIASDVGPYKSLKKGTALLTPNTGEAWYIALKTLVENEWKRTRQLQLAQKELLNWRLEGNWQAYQKLFTEVRAL